MSDSKQILSFEKPETKIEYVPMRIENKKGTIIINYFRDKDVYTFEKNIDVNDRVLVEIDFGSLFISLYDGEKYFYPVFILGFDKFINFEFKM